MIVAITFVFSIVFTILFIYITDSIYKSSRMKAIAFCKFSLSFKVAIYIPCLFVFAYYLNSIRVPKLLSFLPILYIMFLLLVDSALFFKTVKKIRGVTISFKRYLRIVCFEALIIVIPSFFLIILREFSDNNDTLFYIILVIFVIAYNLLYPVLMQFKYKAVRHQFEELGIFGSDNKFNLFIYNGTVTKEANVLISGIIPPYSMFISDYLVDHTTKQELEAIIYHEIGHIKKAHLLIRNLFLLSCYPVLVSVGFVMDVYFYDTNILLGILIFVSLIILYGGVLFLLISRHQEYQADNYAVKECKNKDVYISALKKLQYLNETFSRKPKAKELFSTHPTIENRIKQINKKFNNE